MFLKFIISYADVESSRESALGSYVYVYEGTSIDWAVEQITHLTPLDKEVSRAIVQLTLDKTDRDHPMFTRRVLHDLCLTVIRIW